MPKNKGTVATFAVTIVIPTKSNCHEMQLYLRDAISGYKGGLDPDNPIAKLHPDDFTVALRKKETTYA